MWVSIEDELPMMMIEDLVKRGFRVVKCKFIDGEEGECKVSDHHTWYEVANDIGISHWWKDDPSEITARPL